MNALDHVLKTVRGNPGATEAGVRSELRSTYGSSQALDTALAAKLVERRGVKLYIVDPA